MPEVSEQCLKAALIALQQVRAPNAVDKMTFGAAQYEIEQYFQTKQQKMSEKVESIDASN
jgi:hypothetical protein